MKYSPLSLALAAAVAAATAAPALAVTYSTAYTALNGSGISGTATVTIDGSTMTIDIQATGLTANQRHSQDIHPGRVPLSAVADLDGDGFVETFEAEAVLGDPILSLTETTSPTLGGTTNDALFPMVGADGALSYQRTYTLSDADLAAIGDLEGRFIDIHGTTVPPGAGAGTLYEVSGTGGYIPELPAAGGFLTMTDPGTQAPIPEPAALSLLALSVGALGLRLRRR